MSVAAKLHVGMSLAPTWLSGEAWRRADSDINRVFSSDYFVDLAQRAEAAHVDFVFRPDTLFLRTEGLETGGGFASMDPTMLLSAIARKRAMSACCPPYRPHFCRPMWWPASFSH